MKKSVSIVGGGASALMLGAQLNPDIYDVAIYERNAGLGRKFLVAGDGGLNLTHSENPDQFINRYTPNTFISEAFLHFSNVDFIEWLRQKGIPTFTGSSKRIFPLAGMKPIEVLNKLEKAVLENKTIIHYKYIWEGFAENKTLVFNSPIGEKKIYSDLTIFCLGGASWSVTGSRGDWAQIFREKGIRVNDFLPSNCAYRVAWPEERLPFLEGKALKNIQIQCGDKTHFGEIVLTRFGMEGSGLYPLSPEIRQRLLADKRAEIRIDLKPGLSVSRIEEVLASQGSSKLSERLKSDLRLNAAAIALIKTVISKEQFLDPAQLAFCIKNLPINISDFGALEEAISTVGGISLEEIDQNFELKRCPGVFVIGEMLDYDAPTGGYLLQSCFTMANFLANYLNGLQFA